MTERPEVAFVLLQVDQGRIETEGVGVSHVDAVCCADEGGADRLPGLHRAVLQRTGAEIIGTSDGPNVAAALRLRRLVPWF
jgi:hypothetical protein